MSQTHHGTDPLLEVDTLQVSFRTLEGATLRAVDGVSLRMGPSDSVGLVGESGCGKSVTALALTRLLPSPPAVYGGRVLLRGSDVLNCDRAELAGVRGRGIAYVFQDPSNALNPLMRVGPQIVECIRHAGGAARSEEAARLLGCVGIAEPFERLRAYPHELSGGMKQRVMIAMALAQRPALLVADEPTTALDVTIQAQVLQLLSRLRDEFRMALLLITHNLGVVAGCTDTVHVMYAGRIVESGPTRAVLALPRHPYTRGLMDAVPRLKGGDRLQGIGGTVPSLADLPSGCAFAPRCPRAAAKCREQEPGLEERKDGRTEERKDGRTEERKDGRTEGRKDGRTEERKNVRTEERKNGRTEERKQEGRRVRCWFPLTEGGTGGPAAVG